MEVSSPSLLIDSARLHSLLGKVCARLSIEAIAECESTNTRLLQSVAQNGLSGQVVVCDRQTAGRGSRGRRWAASPEASLTFSLLWRFDCEMAQLSGLSLGVGLAVVRALARCGVDGIALKWPNDILFNDAKLGGVLVELSGDAEQARAVIGIGLNLRQLALPDSGEMMMPVTALDAIVAEIPERSRLLASMLIELAAVFDTFSVHGFAALRQEWQACHAWQDRPVRVLRNGVVEKEGVCRGADGDGALRIEIDGQVERCLSGDVSLRAAP